MADTIKFKVTHGKIQINVSLGTESKLKDLKIILEQQTGVPVMLQKLFFKGPLKNDDLLLISLKLRESSKLLLVGSTANEISETSNIRTMVEEEKKFDIPRDSFTQDQQKIIDKGPSVDCIPPDLFNNSVIPDTSPGLYNHIGSNIRLTIKKDTDEI